MVTLTSWTCLLEGCWRPATAQGSCSPPFYRTSSTTYDTATGSGLRTPNPSETWSEIVAYQKNLITIMPTFGFKKGDFKIKMQCLIQPAINLSNQKPESIDGRLFTSGSLIWHIVGAGVVIPFKNV